MIGQVELGESDGLAQRFVPWQVTLKLLRQTVIQYRMQPPQIIDLYDVWNQFDIMTQYGYLECLTPHC